MDGIDVKITMKNGDNYTMTVKADNLKQIVTTLNKHKFIYLGSIALNTNEIQSVETLEGKVA